MKILIILIRLAGGVGRANTEIANALEKKGHKVDILSREDHLKIFSFFGSIFLLRKKVKQLMKKENYDIIYTQDYSCALPLLFPYPIFWKKHFYALIGVKWKPSIQIIVHNTVGKIMGRKTIVLFEHNKKRFPKATVIYRGVNTQKFKPLNKKRDCFGFMNKFSELGNTKDYIRIAKKMSLKPIYSGEKRKRKRIRRTFSKENQHCFDKFSDNEMNNFYNQCKVFINLATPDAGFNLSWLEAMSAGVPVVIGNNNGAGPILPFNKIDSWKNSKDLEKQIKKIIKNPKKINYRKWIIENDLTWKRATEQLIKFFEKHLKK